MMIPLTNLLVKVGVRQGKFHRLSNFLLLHVQTTHVGIRDIRLLICPEHGNRGISLGWQNVHE